MFEQVSNLSDFWRMVGEDGPFFLFVVINRGLVGVLYSFSEFCVDVLWKIVAIGYVKNSLPSMLCCSGERGSEDMRLIM
jgi:hypothetical protein